ncbi:MAG: hypothetical protein HN736_14865 [Anaerolineae bacterium]|jgi:deoxyadenosine/deoxycytidine kinase|nr:hypothetical protein [Anaerolineae bacterium]MBT3713872.1 hypothetical protein [Anaerolineae bacterium]MBT4308875.1 hypothetical protein [Anaerolineae bacterium]MBT4458464.1 hypothetical protein [Anaerolineae bacterium]MBT4843539.1 hypothetical protein [Anaerolineae bacterium]
MPITKEDFLVGVVGPCSAGKSTLVAGLKKRGVNIRQIAQEHSYVKDMWRRLTNPDILIFLQVSYPVAQERRKLNWAQKEYKTQQHRLRDARQYTDFYLDTDELTPEDILNLVLKFITEVYDAPSN